jgi:hypothetical protein
MFRKLGSSHLHVIGGRHILLGPLETANLNHWSTVSHNLKKETDPIFQTCCFLYYVIIFFRFYLEFLTMNNGQSPYTQ